MLMIASLAHGARLRSAIGDEGRSSATRVCNPSSSSFGWPCSPSSFSSTVCFGYPSSVSAHFGASSPFRLHLSAPSEYLAKLEKGDKETPAIERNRLDEYLRTHLIDPTLLRSDAFETFMEDRRRRLLELIEKATGKAAYTGDVPEEGVDVGGDADTVEVEMLITS